VVKLFGQLMQNNYYIWIDSVTYCDNTDSVENCELYVADLIYLKNGRFLQTSFWGITVQGLWMAQSCYEGCFIKYILLALLLWICMCNNEILNYKQTENKYWLELEKYLSCIRIHHLKTALSKFRSPNYKLSIEWLTGTHSCQNVAICPLYDILRNVYLSVHLQQVSVSSFMSSQNNNLIRN